MIRLGSKRKERVIYNPEPHHHYTLVQLLRENSLEKNGSFLYVDLKKNNWIMSYLIKGCPPNKIWQMCLHFRPLQEIYFFIKEITDYVASYRPPHLKLCVS